MKATRIRYNYELIGLARGLRHNMTPAEKKLWYLLKEMPLKFRRQRPIGMFIVDFYCPSAKLVVEVDGESHFTEHGKAYDAERSAYLERQGLRVIRFTNAEVMENLEGVHQRIEEALTG
ncbi:MAG: endonuclease domain-containing protein [Meiothermus sp.]|nr:endonuclease domain-containing protein [Meiothermus sp.]